MTYILSLLLLVTVAAPSRLTAGDEEKKTKILTTFFPVYLFTLNLTYNIPDLQVDILLPGDYGCPHDYSLAPEDIKKAHLADLVIINGLGLDDFVEDILAGKDEIALIDATSGIAPLPSRASHAAHNHEVNDSLWNPHLFASPLQAQAMISRIATSLTQYLPQYADRINANAADYMERLDSVVSQYRSRLTNLSNPKVAAVHEIYDYLARDFGFQIVDIIEKEPGQEPSARETIALSGELRRNKIAAIFAEPQYSERMACTLASELKVPAYVIDPVATGPSNPPRDYYETVMLENLENLVKAMK
ncbi:MAG: zinc ABC transporter substrate-binding protein [bacterium]